ncbi:MAG: AAA family ATPase [Cellulomonadaceae bacterium]|nr:AAA family ATPase [Cellulomonadaceae bacterium]
MHTPPTPEFTARIDELVKVTTRVREALASVVVTAPEVPRLTVAVLLAGGHLLIEDVPGVGKTTLANALARSIHSTMGRVQFTPDLLPSDLTGVSIYQNQTGEFIFRPGPVFNSIVIGDEINRASPKTQSALLECMEEHQVTVDGESYPLPEPFLVVATQNPVELEGTYPLPEAQRDRFMARLAIGYPDAAGEMVMLDRLESASPLDALEPVTTGAAVLEMQRLVPQVFASDAVKEYVLRLVTATREHSATQLGASPRASLQLLRAAKALAAMEGRTQVSAADVQELAVPVLAHRLILTGQARITGTSAADLMAEIVADTPLPAETAVAGETAVAPNAALTVDH